MASFQQTMNFACGERLDRIWGRVRLWILTDGWILSKWMDCWFC